MSEPLFTFDTFTIEDACESFSAEKAMAMSRILDAEINERIRKKVAMADSDKFDSEKFGFPPGYLGWPAADGHCRMMTTTPSGERILCIEPREMIRSNSA